MISLHTDDVNSLMPGKAPWAALYSNSPYLVTRQCKPIESISSSRSVSASFGRPMLENE